MEEINGTVFSIHRYDLFLFVDGSALMQGKIYRICALYNALSL